MYLHPVQEAQLSSFRSAVDLGMASLEEDGDPAFRHELVIAFRKAPALLETPTQAKWAFRPLAQELPEGDRIRAILAELRRIIEAHDIGTAVDKAQAETLVAELYRKLE